MKPRGLAAAEDTHTAYEQGEATVRALFEAQARVIGAVLPDSHKGEYLWLRLRHTTT